MVMTDGTVYRFITDHLGSLRLVVNAETGAVVQRIDYDAFGRVLNADNPNFQPFGFAGGLYDHDAGLVRFGARDYDAHSGRWTAKDPVLFGGGDSNLYAYVNGDAVNALDPNGLDSFSIGGSASAAAVGFGGSVSFSGTFIFDQNGINASALNFTVSYGAAAAVTLALAGGVYVEVTDAEELSDLEGEGRYFGRSGVGPFYVGYVDAPGCYQGFEFSGGYGLGFQFSGAGKTQTWTFGGGPWD